MYHQHKKSFLPFVSATSLIVPFLSCWPFFWCWWLPSSSESEPGSSWSLCRNMMLEVDIHWTALSLCNNTLSWSLIAAVAGTKNFYFVYNSVASISPSPGVFRRLCFSCRPKPPPCEQKTDCVHHLEKSCIRALKFEWWQDLITTFQVIFVTGITFSTARMCGCQAMSTWKVPSLDSQLPSLISLFIYLFDRYQRRQW